MPSTPTWLTKNVGLKILALLLALVVYVHVYTEQERESTLSLPVQVTNLPQNLVLESRPPRSAEVAVRGKGKQLFLLRYRHPRINLDLSEIHPGKVQRMLSPADVVLPVGAEVSVTDVLAPRLVSLDVDTLVTRRVEVRVAVAGDLPEGTVLAGPIRPQPATVGLTGPAGALDGVESVATEPLHLDEVRGSSGFELAVRPGRAGVQAAPSSVRVDVPLLTLVRRTFTRVPVRVRGLPPRYRAKVEPDSAAVAVYGPESVVDSLAGDALAVNLDAGDLGPGRHLLAPEVDLPGRELRLLNIQPARFLVEIGSRRP